MDDREENLFTLAAVLESSDYEVVRALSGREALQLVKEYDFAVILMDVHMPILGGAETVKLIKADPKTREIPIILLTAYSADDPMVSEAYTVGVADYLFKPFSPRILRSKVEVFVELHKKNLQIQHQAKLLYEVQKAEHLQKIAQVELEGLRREQRVYEKYRELIEQIPNGTVWTLENKSLNFTILNSQFHQGGASSKSIWNRIPKKDRKTISSAIQKVRKRIEPRASVEHRLIQPDGTQVWLNTNIRLSQRISDESDEIHGLSVDITRLKNSEEAAKKAIDLRDQFMSIASHELKTPMTSLSLQVQILNRYVKHGRSAEFTEHKLLQFTEQSFKQIERLSRLVEQLMDVSRVKSGRISLNFESMNLVDLVQEVVSRLYPQALEANCEMSVHSDKNVIGAWDRIRVEQVITNLVSNAIKYGRGKPVHIRVYSDGELARLDVQDFGIGVAIEDHDRIFGRFERAVHSPDYAGLGLGLFVVKEIIEAHRGTIQVQSELGKGATFRVCLPRIDSLSFEKQRMTAH